MGKTEEKERCDVQEKKEEKEGEGRLKNIF